MRWRRGSKGGRRRRRWRRSLGTFTGGLAVGPCPEANVTLALVRSGQVDTLTSDPTDVLLGALVHIWPADKCNVLVLDLKHTGGERNIFPGRRLTDTLGPPVHQLLVALATEAVVAPVQVDAASSAVAARVCFTLVVVWEDGEEDEEEEVRKEL